MKHLLFATLVVLTACSTERRDGALGAPSSPTSEGDARTLSVSGRGSTGGSMPPANNANAPLNKIFLQVVGVRHGSTSIDESGAHRFVRQLTPAFADVKAALELRAAYLNQNGCRVPVVVEEELGKTPADSRVVITAAVPLAVDEWYWLTVLTDEGLTIQDPDRSAYGQLWSTHFFTGSAPRIARVEIPTAGKPMNYVAVTFSEPIRLDLVKATSLASGSGISGQCLLKGTTCWSGGEAWISEVAFVGVKTFLPAGPMNLALGPNVKGTARTAGEGAIFSGQADAKTGGVGVTVDNLIGGKWVDVAAPPEMK